MLTAFKEYLRLALAPALYFCWIFTVIITIFKEVEWGLFLLIAMIPQPNVWYKVQQFPMGHSFIDFLFFGVLLGIFLQKKSFDKPDNAIPIFVYSIVSYIALWNSSMRFSLPLPITIANHLLRDWKNYAEMIFLYFLAFNVFKEKDRQKSALVLIAVVILLIAIRSYRNFEGGSAFDYDKRDGGPFEAAGLGANHLGAFIIDYCAIFLGLLFFDNDKRRRLLYLGTVLFGLHPLFFSYSRGAYAAALGTVAFYGILKKRSMLLLAIIILLSWDTVLPASVVDRIKMTKAEDGQIEHSAAGRLELWKYGISLFEENPLFGVGFGGYSLSTGGVTIENGQKEVLRTGIDVHSFFVKTLSEQGVVGIALFLFILYRAFRSGWRLFKIGEEPFYKGLGFGFMGCVVSMAVTNMFGDRWSYFCLGGYFWILWGIVDRAIFISKNIENQVKDIAIPA